MKAAICDICNAPAELCRCARPEERDPMAIATDQIADALSDLDRHPDSYVRWPWRDVDEIYGGMAPGTVHYVVGFSGIGKSTFIASAIMRWKDQGRKVDVMPLEIKPKTFRTYLACQELCIDPGLMLSGDFWKQPNGQALRDAVKAKVMDQAADRFVEHVVVGEVSEVTVNGLVTAAREAARRGAEILVVDHIDHIDVDDERARSQYEASVRVNKAALRVAQETELVLICMSQANQAALSGTADHLAKYMPLREHHVLNGGHKRQNATGMLGLYRPLLPMPPMADEERFEEWRRIVAAARNGTAEPKTALEPNVMGVSLMKSRNYGGREGSRIALTWQHGRIVDRDVLPFALRDRGAA